MQLRKYSYVDIDTQLTSYIVAMYVLSYHKLSQQECLKIQNNTEVHLNIKMDMSTL